MLSKKNGLKIATIGVGLFLFVLISSTFTNVSVAAETGVGDSIQVSEIQEGVCPMNGGSSCPGGCSAGTCQVQTCGCGCR